MLSTYLTQVQRLLGTGATGTLFDNASLTAFINEGRQQVAMEAQCIRLVPPTSGPLTAVTINSGGSAYGAGTTVLITTPDSPSGSYINPNGVQATATLQTGANGAVTVINVTNGGDGYFAPVVTFSSVGTGCTVTTVVSGINQTYTGQEVYPFSSVSPMVATSGSGIQNVYFVNSVSLLWGTFRYTLIHKSFSQYQAYVRNYTTGYQYIPAVFSQVGQGVNGTLYMYPVPNTNYQMEWDCSCLPTPLTDDSSPEAIPQPWQDCVQYYAAYKAFLQAQRFADADKMFNESPQAPGLYQRYMHRARRLSSKLFTTNWYGR